LEKTLALSFENVIFFKKPLLYAFKMSNFKLTMPSLVGGGPGAGCFFVILMGCHLV
jgi:hypothetical protein